MVITVERLDADAGNGTIEVRGVAAGPFEPDLWWNNTPTLVPDIRRPVIAPGPGAYRNIYAPSVVETPDGWRIFYGAWDGVATPNDRIYSTTTADFLRFDDRHMVIDHGCFTHVCNVSAVRIPSGAWRLMCTAYPVDGLNKPALFTSDDGVHWNGSASSYVAARKNDLISIRGYDLFDKADINGMNVLLYEDGTYRLYFNDFKNHGKTFRASSKDPAAMQFDGEVVNFPGIVNDVKKLTVGGRSYYLMALHQNGDKLWYSLSTNGLKFDPPRLIATNVDDADRYIVAVGWVVRENRVLGLLYGAGATSALNENRIWARWLQKRVVLTLADGTRIESAGALGPDRQIFRVPEGKPLSGTLTVYAEDGTLIGEQPVNWEPHGVYAVKIAAR